MKIQLPKSKIYLLLKKFNRLNLFNFIIKNNTNLIFECDDFCEEYGRLVWFKNNKKYSILNVDEKKFNYSKAIPKELNSKCFNGLCISNQINVKNSKRFSNFCNYNGKIIIYDEECYIPFLDIHDELPDYILKYIDYDTILSFENDHIVYIKNNEIFKKYYYEFIIQNNN